MFNKIRIGAACVVLVSGLGMAGTANAATTASAQARALILQALDIQSDGSKLDFGTIAYNGAGTVAVSAAGARTCSANLVCSGSTSAAGFDVTGGADQNVGVTMGSGSITISNGTNTMTVDSFTNSLVSSTGNLGSGGAFSFTVGGTVHVAGTESAGLYTGNFSVNVAYQ